MFSAEDRKTWLKNLSPQKQLLVRDHELRIKNMTHDHLQQAYLAILTYHLISIKTLGAISRKDIIEYIPAPDNEV